MNHNGNGHRLILVAGYPKSGTTWLTRLMADALNAPVRANVPQKDDTEWLLEGQDRDGLYTVRRGHYVIQNDGPCLFPAEHRLVPKFLGDALVIFIVRDPRAVLLSAKDYFGKSMEETFNRMTGKGKGFNKIPSWNGYISEWLEASFPYTLMKYEELAAEGWARLALTMAELGLPYNCEHLKKVWKRQSLEERKARINEKKGEDRFIEARLLNRGEASRWRRELDKSMIEAATQEFSSMMLALGYSP